MKKFRTLLKEGIILSAITLPFFLWIGKRYINLDFSYDEFFTFDCFVFVPLKKTVTDYGAPNNHIFSSILHSLYLKLIGINDLFTLMDTPYKIRLLDLGFSIMTMGYIYYIGKKFFSNFVARLSLLLLVTTVPFYNFAVLVRGYSLSMMFVSMMLYYVWNFEATGKRRNAVAIVLIATLSLYTIPLNLYFLGSVTIFYFLSGVYQLVVKSRKTREHEEQEGMSSSKNHRSFWHENREFLIVGLICLGIAIATFIYLPFYKNLINNRHFKSHGLFYLNTLTQLMPQSFRYYLSERYLLLPIALVGVSGYMFSALRRKHPKRAYKLACCVIAVCTPFVLSFIRGDHPPSRALVNITPVFVLVVAISLSFLEAIIKKRVYLHIMLVSLMVYCYGTFAYTTHSIEQGLKTDIEQNRNRYDMYYNYFQAYYRPMKLVKHFIRNYQTDTIPLTLVFNLEEYEMRRYFDKFQVRYYQHPYEVLFNPNGQAYVAVAFSQKFIANLSKVIPDIQCTDLNEGLNYHKILLCESALLRKH